ncbi:uncharacterized protein LOC109807216 [Cajanus cajan]|uniref:Uncharacterized protein n=1 Tax=Cajanus cajan TaxID=3821 RepID=A0A151SPL6_CAJCA|nr:uncharacterized protein LOC109807216 [Cajanus cajan]KYP56776.1 hypothetical protein KK1_003023 [Cajanus cajan]
MAIPCPSSRSQTWTSKKKTCMCSPTTHPGSFRCAYHKQQAERQQTASWSGGRKLVKRALTTLVRPSSHHLRRREAFQPRPTRLSVMSSASASASAQHLHSL